MTKKTSSAERRQKTMALRCLRFTHPVRDGSGTLVSEVYEDEADWGIVPEIVPLGPPPSALDPRQQHQQVMPVPMWRVIMRGKAPYARALTLPIQMAHVETPKRWVEHVEGEERAVEILEVGQYEQRQRRAEAACGTAAGTATSDGGAV